MLTFAQPWMLLIGAVAAAAPFVVHWLTRPRPAPLPFSTLKFVREAIRQRRSAHRLRDLVILAMRTLAILLIAIAFAGPQWGGRPLVDSDAGDAVRVVAVDVSQSMAAADGAVEAIERARSVASRYLQYRPGLQANLILIGARPRTVFDDFSTNFEALREGLADANALPERANVDAALEEAARLLAATDENDDRQRELVIVSDFQRAGWSSARFDAIPAGVKIQFERVAPPAPPTNLALTRALARPLGASQDRLLLEATVGNYGPAPRQAAVEVALGDGIYRLSGICAAESETTLSAEAPVRVAGWLWGSARLLDVQDALAADDARPLAVHLRGRPQYALVTAERSRTGVSSSYLLACALAPDTAGDEASQRVRRVDPAAMDAESLEGAQLVAIVRPGKLSDDAIVRLGSQLRRGRPVLYVASDPTDAQNLDRLAENAGIDLPVRFVPPPAGSARRDLFLTDVSQDESPFAIFGDSLPAIVRPLRFSGGLATQENAEAGGLLKEATLARYGDGSAALVVAGADAGELGIVNADLANSNIWKSSAFVPIVDELVQRLLGSARDEESRFPGEPLVARIGSTATAAEMTIVGDADVAPPSVAGESPFGELEDDGAGGLWTWSVPETPGIYRVIRGDQTEYVGVVALPPEESDLGTLSADVLQDRVAEGKEVYVRSRNDPDRPEDDSWKWFAVGAALCVLGEIGALTLFRA